ncbi:MAG TPA: c-type cytochrome [Nitrospiria bacterium]|nr:c-type cytochrome [Candidatus Manganitrophaceae bacterium]
MNVKKGIKQPILWGSLLFMILLFIPATALFAETVESVYRDIPGIGSRNLIWVLSQVHILFGAFVLGVPMFIITIEVIGIMTKEKRYDRLALEFMDLIVACFATTAMVGILFLFSLLVFYPTLMTAMADIFKPTYFVYVFLFLYETLSVYVYWDRWEKWQNRKGLHLFWGVMLNIAGLLLVILPSGFLSFQASPVVLNPDLGPWAKAWTAINNPTWLPVIIHRVVGNLILGGFVCGAYAGVAYLGAKTQEEREHYDWMGYIGNFIGVFGLLPMPFAGYFLMREVYEYNQQMGITLMGGILSWLFILQAVLIGVLFVGSNYYFWQGIAYRTHSAPKYKKPIIIMLVVLVASFSVWLTPHSLVASVSEARAMGGAHHPLLGVFGVMSAKLTVVNLMILTTFVCFLLYWRADKVITVKWGKWANIFTVLLLTSAVIVIIWLGVYGYFVPSVYRVNVLSVAQVLAVLFCLFTITPLTALSLKSAKLTHKMKWGVMPARSQYALVINAVFVVLTMALMGYARSASRVHWHIYGVLEDTSPYAYTPTLGLASFLFVLSTAIFCILVGIVFWTSHTIRHNRFSTRYFFLAPVFMWFTELFSDRPKERPSIPQGGGKYVITKVSLVVGLFLFAYSYVGYQVPQKIGFPPEKKGLDLTKIKTKADMVQIGQDIFYSKGQCALCHAIGAGAGRCPNLSGVGARLTREFIYETLTKPDAYVKLDFTTALPVSFSAQMPAINKPPIGLTEEELITIIAFVQSNGGKVTVTPEDLAWLADGPALEMHDVIPEVEPAELIEEESEEASEELAMIHGESSEKNKHFIVANSRIGEE